MANAAFPVSHVSAGVGTVAPPASFATTVTVCVDPPTVSAIGFGVNVNVFWTRPQVYYDSAAWRGTWEFDGGALMTQASHYIDLLDWLIGSGSLDGKPAAWLSVAAPGQDDGARAALETVLAHCGARLVRPACIRVPLTPEAIDAQGTINDMQLHTALLDVLHGLARSTVLAAPSDQPSWQAYSSVFPVVMRQRPQRPHNPWHHQGS